MCHKNAVFFQKKVSRKNDVFSENTCVLNSYISGTSTGGILALGLSVPGDDGKPKYSASQISGLYERNASEIFDASYFSFGGMAKPKYNTEGFEEVMNSYFGDTLLSQSVTNTLITSYEIERDVPFYFKSLRAKIAPQRNFFMKDIARATGAAPTYFSPARINNLSGDLFTLIDGGVVINNPTISAALHGRLLFPDVEHMMVVSLGTGITTKSIMYEDIKDSGGIGWINPLLSTMMDGASNVVDHQMKYLFSSDPRKSYYRLQPTIPVGNSEMDNTTPSNLHMLNILGERAVNEFDDQLKAIAKALGDSERLKPRNLKLGKTQSLWSPR